MGFMDKINELKAGAINQFNRFNNKTMMEGTMAGLALVANANGVLKDEEMQVMIAAISRDQDLQCFDVQEMIKIFNERIEDFKVNAIIGETTCLAAVGKIKDETQAKMLIGKCVAIASADGDFDDNEKGSVRKMCTSMDISPALFDL